MNFNNIVTIGKKYGFLFIKEERDNCDNLFSFLRSKFKVKKTFVRSPNMVGVCQVGQKSFLRTKKQTSKILTELDVRLK